MTEAPDFEDELRGAAPRVTRPRPAVLSAVRAHPHADTDSPTGTVRAGLGAVSHQAVHDAPRALAAARPPRRVRLPGPPARHEARAGDNHHHGGCRSCRAVADVDCAVGDTPCPSAFDDHGFVTDEAEVVHRGLCPDCPNASSS